MGQTNRVKTTLQIDIKEKRVMNNTMNNKRIRLAGIISCVMVMTMLLTLLPAQFAVFADETEEINVENQEELEAALLEAGTNGKETTVILNCNIQISGIANKTNQLNVPKSAKVTIRSKEGQNYTLTELTEFAYDSSGERHGLIVNNGTLTLKDIILDSNGKGRGVVVNNSAVLTLESGAVLKNGAENFNSGSGLGVYVTAASRKSKGGTFYMKEGARIIDNNARGNGGANGSARGIGVFIGDYGTMVMTGGSISNNKCTGIGDTGVFTSAYSQRGGGIAAKYATVDISGGEISNNVSLDGGGGICNDYSDVTIRGNARIENNIACNPELERHGTPIGGAIYMYGGTLTIDDNAAISGNLAESRLSTRFNACGGALYLISGTVNINGGIISGNKASFDGAELSSDDEDTEYLYDNYLEGAGGAVYIQGGTVKMTGGNITGNTAESTRVKSALQGCGGGIYLGYTNGNGGTSNPEDKGSFDFTGGTVKDNIASGSGKDIYVADRLTAVTNTAGQGSSAIAVTGEIAGCPDFTVNASPKAGDIYLPAPSECLLGSTESTGYARVTVTDRLAEDAELNIITETNDDGLIVGQSGPGYIITNDDADHFKLDSYELDYVLNYSGYIVIGNKQEKSDISSAVLFVEDAVYSAKGCEPDVRVVLDDTELVKDEDFSVSYSNNIDAGEAYAVINGINKYTGTLTGTFHITPASLAGDEVRTGDMPAGYYTGMPVDAQIRLYFDDYELEKDKDYTVVYDQNTEPGTAYALVTGIGNFKDEIKLEYAILNSDGYTLVSDETGLRKILAADQGSPQIPVNLLLTSDIYLTEPLITGTGTYINILGNGHTVFMAESAYAADDDPLKAMFEILGESCISMSNMTVDGCLNARILYAGKEASYSADKYTVLQRGAAANVIKKEFGGQIIYNEGRVEFEGFAGNTGSVLRGYGGILNKGSFELKEGGRIGNILTCFGGAVYNDEGAQFTLSGGEITGSSTNAKASLGTGITNLGSVLMESGSISGNNGPGAALYNKGIVLMKGGSISDNVNTIATWGIGARTHAISGGGVFQCAGEFTMESGDISGNKAVEGGGVLVISGTFEMNGADADIIANTAKDDINSGTNEYNFGNGGGVFINGGTFIMKDGRIADNIAGYSSVEGRTKSYSGYGSAIFINGGTVDISGGQIKGNNGVEAYGCSNAIYFGNASGIDRTEDDPKYPGEVVVTDSSYPAVLKLSGSPDIGDDIFVKQNNVIMIPKALGNVSFNITPKLINAGNAVAEYEQPESGQDDFISDNDADKFISKDYSYVVNKSSRRILSGVNLAECDINVSDVSYTGNIAQPDISVIAENGSSVSEYTYEIISDDKVNAGEKLLAIKGNGISVTGEAEVTFHVLQKELSSDMLTLENGTYTYTGEEIRPDLSINITRNNTALTEDFLVTYENNIKPGTASITVTAVQNGNLKGTASAAFEIIKAEQGIKTSKDIYAVKADTKPFNLGVQLQGDGELTYESSDENILNVNEKGNVTVKSAGRAYVVITASETELYKQTSKKIAVTVEKAPQNISIGAATGNSISKTYGDKAFPLNAASSGGGKLSYSSSDSKAAVISNTGNVTIKGCGVSVIKVNASETADYKSAEKTVTLKVSPNKAVIISAKNTAKKTVTAKWKKDTTATGYQVRYAANKSMKKAVIKTVSGNKKTSLKLKKLKKGRSYYVQIREYYLVDKSTGSALFGEWSVVKKVKVKK